MLQPCHSPFINGMRDKTFSLFLLVSSSVPTLIPFCFCGCGERRRAAEKIGQKKLPPKRKKSQHSSHKKFVAYLCHMIWSCKKIRFQILKYIPRQPPKQPLISTVELSKLIEFILILHFEFVYLSSTHPSDIQAKWRCMLKAHLLRKWRAPSLLLSACHH